MKTYRSAVSTSRSSPAMFQSSDPTKKKSRTRCKPGFKLSLFISNSRDSIRNSGSRRKRSRCDNLHLSDLCFILHDILARIEDLIKTTLLIRLRSEFKWKTLKARPLRRTCKLNIHFSFYYRTAVSNI